MNYYLVLLFLISSSLVISVVALPKIEYHKDSTPLFTFSGAPLINSVRGGFTLGRENFQGPLMNINDSNISLKYLMYGRLVAKESPVLSFGDIYERDPKTGEWHIVETSEKNKQPQETPYETKTTGIEEFLTPDISEQITYSVEYEIKSQNISWFAPFIFDLGIWPQYINGTDGTIIEKKLEVPITQDLIIYGDTQILVVRKDANEFNYVIRKELGNYLLYIEKNIQKPESGVIKCYLRPVLTGYKVEIEEVNWGSFNEPISFRPHLILNVSDKNITTFKFTYHSEKGDIPVSLDLDQNGEVEFFKTIYPIGTEILYPFDHYVTEIEVYPPLLNKSEKDIDMPYGSNLKGVLTTENNKFIITITRELVWILKYFILLSLCILPIFIGIYYHQYQVLQVTGVIIALITFILNNNLRYWNSVGSLTSVVVLIITLWILWNHKTLYGA